MPISRNRPDTKAGSQIGRSVQRLESRDKVTGRAEYTHLTQLPGMLHAKLFRSTVAHGRIRSLNLGLAKQAAGILHVVTIADIKKLIPDPYYGPAFHDQPILADGKVRFIGEPVGSLYSSLRTAIGQLVRLQRYSMRTHVARICATLA
jgi:CO/xanthine dehydrogenase Mo-binding subunit